MGRVEPISNGNDLSLRATSTLAQVLLMIRLLDFIDWLLGWLTALAVLTAALIIVLNLKLVLDYLSG